MESWGWGRVNPAGGGDNSVRLWDLSSGRDVQKYPGHWAGVRTAVFSRDGGFAASCGGFWDNQHFDVYDLTVGRRIHEFELPAASPRLWAATVGFSRDGQRLLVAFPNGTVQPWILETEKALPLIRLQAGKPDTYEFPAMLFTSDGNHLITGGKSGAVELWVLKTGERLKAFAGHTDALRMLAVSANDGLILSGGTDDTARLWDVASGKQLRLLDCREDGLESLALSPDGQRALTGGRYGTIRLWDLGKGHEIGRLEGHTLRVGCLAFSPDGRRAVSGGDDKTVRIWQISTPAAP
jgi:WD40 repeat protein